MKKIIVVIIAVAVLIAAAEIIFWLAPKHNKSQELQEQTLSVIDLQKTAFDRGYKYDVDSVEFVVYSPNIENYEFGYFEAYNNGNLVYKSTPLYMVSDLFAFETNDGKYVVVSDYSGGAHCCFKNYVFLLKNGELKLIKDLFTGNAVITKDALILKDNSVYIKVFDDRFAYFYAPYAGSYFFPQYLKVSGDNMEIDNSSFKQDYLQEAQKCSDEIEQMFPDSSLGFESYSPKLVCVAVNYLLAGEGDEGWSRVENYFGMIPSGQIDFETFKQEFADIYQKEAFLDIFNLPDKQTVSLFYYNPQNDKDENGNTMCSRQGLVQVQREVSSDDVIKNAIDELLKGNLTQEEKDKGVTTEYPLNGFSLLSYELNNGTLNLTFDDLDSQTVGGSCRVGILWFQIEATAKQFPGVNSVRFLPEDIFQP